MSPPAASALPAGAPEPALPAAAPAGADAPICLDFLKGRCARNQCRFLHPDLSQYQQLSGAVQAQAGRRVCEVWAMTGQCKFGAKCSRLHPSVVVNPQPQPMLTLLLPLTVVPQPVPTAAPAAPFNHRPAPAPPASPLFQPGPATPASPPSAVPACHPMSPLVAQPTLAYAIQASAQHMMPNVGAAAAGALPPQPPLSAPPRPQHATVPRSPGDPQADFQELARTLLQGLEAARGYRAVLPTAKGLDPPPALSAERGRSLACLFGEDPKAGGPAPAPAASPAADGVPPPPRRRPANPQHDRDRAFLDMLRSLHNAGC